MGWNAFLKACQIGQFIYWNLFYKIEISSRSGHLHGIIFGTQYWLPHFIPLYYSCFCSGCVGIPLFIPTTVWPFLLAWRNESGWASMNFPILSGLKYLKKVTFLWRANTVQYRDWKYECCPFQTNDCMYISGELYIRCFPCMCDHRNTKRNGRKGLISKCNPPKGPV